MRNKCNLCLQKNSAISRERIVKWETHWISKTDMLLGINSIGAGQFCYLCGRQMIIHVSIFIFVINSLIYCHVFIYFIHQSMCTVGIWGGNMDQSPVCGTLLDLAWFLYCGSHLEEEEPELPPPAEETEVHQSRQGRSADLLGWPSITLGPTSWLKADFSWSKPIQNRKNNRKISHSLVPNFILSSLVLYGAWLNLFGKPIKAITPDKLMFLPCRFLCSKVVYRENKAWLLF